MDRLDTNIAVLLRDDLDGTASLAMFRQPVVVMAGGKETMQGPHVRAPVRGPPVAIFTSELLTTGNDATIVLRCRRFRVQTSIRSAWPCTPGATSSTRWSRARGCTHDAVNSQRHV